MSANGFPNHDLTRTASKAPVEATQNNDMLSGMLLEDAVLHNAIKKLHNPIDKTAFLGFMAGVWVGKVFTLKLFFFGIVPDLADKPRVLGFGGLAALSVAGGIPVDVRARWPVLPKLGLGFFFPFALVRLFSSTC